MLLSLSMIGLSSNQLKAGLYMLLNIVSATSIVFANKLVLSVYKFHFVYALTLIHTVTTMVHLNAVHCGPTLLRTAHGDWSSAVLQQRFRRPSRSACVRVSWWTALHQGRAVLQVGMWTFASFGLFQSKGLKAMQVSGYPGYCGLSSKASA